MLVQNYLANNSLSSLKDELGIESNIKDDLVILNYSQIDSPKFHPIVKECRGLILKNNTWDLVAKSFDRFYNLGENLEEQNKFNWKDFICTEKQDGSNIIIYHYNCKWRINTRNSFGEGNLPQNTCVNWQNAVSTCVGPRFFTHADPTLTYIFEFCSPWNQIVRRYEKPSLFLLSLFFKDYELSRDIQILEATKLGLTINNDYSFSSEPEISTFLSEKEQIDRTFEGVVVYDGKQRIKIKSKSYIDIHYNFFSKNIFLDKNLISAVLKNEDTEVISYYPELRQKISVIRSKILFHKEQADKLYCLNKHLSVKKDFALKVKDSIYSRFLFQCWNTNNKPSHIMNQDEKFFHNNI